MQEQKKYIISFLAKSTSPKCNYNSDPSIICEWFIPNGTGSCWLWFRMAATRLFPGLANKDTPRVRDTSDAWN